MVHLPGLSYASKPVSVDRTENRKRRKKEDEELVNCKKCKVIKGGNVDPGFRMGVRMTQLPRLLFPASAEFRNFAFKIRAH